MAEAMAATGHDPWWTQYTLVVLGVATVLAVAAKWRIDRLKLLLASVEVVSRTPDIRAYRTEAVDLWRRLFAVVLVALLVQENAEHLATVGHLVGLEPLSSPLAVFAIAVVVAGVAAVGALVRLRIREIEARLAAATRLVWHHSRAALHCVRRGDKTILGVMASTKNTEADVSDLNRQLVDFQSAKF